MHYVSNKDIIISRLSVHFCQDQKYQRTTGLVDFEDGCECEEERRTKRIGGQEDGVGGTMKPMMDLSKKKILKWRVNVEED